VLKKKKTNKKKKKKRKGKEKIKMKWFSHPQMAKWGVTKQPPTSQGLDSATPICPYGVGQTTHGP
jgi:hypothetical protein